jgi:hypothetical protein
MKRTQMHRVGQDEQPQISQKDARSTPWYSFSS